LNTKDLARAEAALERAWMLVVARGLARDSDVASRDCMAGIVFESICDAPSEDDLVALAVQKFISMIDF
jgi:hypothetical protein